MFVRFRKIPCDGFRPNGASSEAAKIMCRGPCRYRNYSCPMKPRCRWRIGRDEQLAPYRLKVILVENKRVNGKVKQETIALLGSIEATWLPEFWEGIDQAATAKLKAEDWELRSLQWRTAFWREANQRLKRLANRLGPDLKRIRIAAHTRVPYPMEPERERLELLQAKADFDFAKDSLESVQRMVETGKKAVKHAQKALTESERLARWEASEAAAASAKLAKLSTRSRP